MKLSLPLKCDRYEISGGYLVNRGPYRPGELDVTVAADADGHTVRTFTDWRGNKVLERRHDGENYMDTYYVNDVWGKPLAVIQPEGSAKLRRQGYRWSLDTDETLQRWAAVYTYDDCRRLQSRRLPGQDKVTFSYDAFGRVAFSQDGNQRARGRKSFMLYDEGGRCVMTGEVNASALSGRKIPAMKARFDAGSSGIGGTHYVADGCGLGIIMIPKALTVTYWDDYSRIDSLREFKCLSRFHFRPFDWMSDGKGLPVATLTATLTGDSGDNSSGKSRPGSGILYLGQSGMLPRLTYYDRDERVVQEIESVDGDSTIITADYGFTPLGVVSRVIGNVYRGNRRYTDDTCFYWDDYNRQTRTTVRIGQTTLTSTMSYDRLGRLVGEERPGGVSVSYGYNIRGQIETLSAGSYFSQRLHYTSVNLGRRCYNGNIARIDYPALPGSDEPARSALFTYDPAGRLSEATLPVGSGSYEYDLNSNLVGIIRVGDVGGGVRDEIDNLTIELDGNRLRKVTDSADEVLVAGSADFHDGADEDIEYTYDANGNLTGDLNKGISTIGYDISGQTSHVVFDNGDRLVYTHDASGRKLATSLYRYETRLVPEKPIVGVGLDGGNVAGGRIGSSVIIPEPKDTVNITIQGRTVLAEKRDYVGAYEFKCDTLVRFNTEAGYWDGNRFHTYIHDYQGNVARVVADGKVIQRNDYYPYGMPAASSTGAEANAYRYGGKEFESRHGLSIYDYEARWMDHALGRFNAPDILAENDLGISPYTYCGGDPVNRIDPTGKSEVRLYFTNLPISNSFFALPFNSANATHSFIVVTRDNDKTEYYYAYGSSLDGLASCFGSLKRSYYAQDLKVAKEKEGNKNYKASFVISPPEGMSQDEFENKVIEVAESFGENPGIGYSLNPEESIEGNCNSSTYTILYKSGVSKEVLQQIQENAPGKTWGFGSIKPWTKEEQDEAVKISAEVQRYDALQKSLP